MLPFLPVRHSLLSLSAMLTHQSLFYSSCVQELQLTHSPAGRMARVLVILPVRYSAAKTVPSYTKEDDRMRKKIKRELIRKNREARRCVCFVVLLFLRDKHHEAKVLSGIAPPPPSPSPQQQRHTMHGVHISGGLFGALCILSGSFLCRRFQKVKRGCMLC